MSELIKIIIATDPAIKNKSLDLFCRDASLETLLEETLALETFRKKESNLYNRVRALFFLYAIHRFYIPIQHKISTQGMIPYEACEHLLKRRFEEAIHTFLAIQKEN